MKMVLYMYHKDEDLQYISKVYAHPSLTYAIK